METICELENVQRRATKIISSLQHLSQFRKTTKPQSTQFILLPQLYGFNHDLQNFK